MVDPSFVEPQFRDGDIEVRFINNEVAVYCTSRGLRMLAARCSALADKIDRGGDVMHVHMGDFGVLTSSSCPFVVAAFPD